MTDVDADVNVDAIATAEVGATAIVFRAKESYMHHYAKLTVQEWLVSAWKFNLDHGYSNKLYIFDWKTDRRDNGIRVEYPILSKSKPSAGDLILGVDTAWVDYPNLDKLAAGVKVEAVLDLAIIEDGRLKYGIEIVHKHLCTKGKREFLKQRCPKQRCPKVNVYELSAEWVLGQIMKSVPPKKWPCIPI
jgi:hypothetical protein